MKKSVLVFILAALVLVACGIWFFGYSASFKSNEILTVTPIIILVGLALIFGFKRFTSAKRGEPSEDELSKKILVKASSVSYYISIYLWLFIMYISDKTTMENHTLIGVGIIGMSLVFAISWAVTYFRGIRNE
jgi:peptidoglycan/LPS O-acetylase OafA/YrhL